MRKPAVMSLGRPPDQRDHVFEPFQQLGDQHTATYRDVSSREPARPIGHGAWSRCGRARRYSQVRAGVQGEPR